MPEKDLKALRDSLREELGRDMTIAEVAADQKRLQRLVAATRMTRGWEARLGLVEPAIGFAVTDIGPK
jgi:hypothetical protein